MSSVTALDSLGNNAQIILNTGCTLCDEALGSPEFLKSIFGFNLSRTIIETTTALVVPSLGQIVEGYLLAFPKRHSPSWASLKEPEFKSFTESVLLSENLIKQRFGQCTIFEHGMDIKNYTGGCGVTHAHVHLVPGDFRLRKALTTLAFEKISNYDHLRNVKSESYILIKNSEGTFLARANFVESQFVRKALAEEAGLPDSWDWKKHIGREKVLRTLEMYSGQMVSMKYKTDDIYARKFIHSAGQVATKSTCGIRRVGAVIVVNGQSVTVGWNSAPEGLPTCDEKGHFWQHGHCVRSIHAEAMCIGNASKLGVSTRGGDLFVTAYPCFSCFKLVVNAGIKRVFFHPYTVDPLVEQSARALGIELLMLQEDSTAEEISHLASQQSFIPS